MPTFFSSHFLCRGTFLSIFIMYLYVKIMVFFNPSALGENSKRKPIEK